MDHQHRLQNVSDLVDVVCGPVNPQLRRHLPTAGTSDLEEPLWRSRVVVIDPQRRRMMRRRNCVEGQRVAIGRMLIQLVVQAVVEDASAMEAVALVVETLDVVRDLFWQLPPG